MNIFSVLNEYVVMALVLLVLLVAGIFIRKLFRAKKNACPKKATGVILALEKLALGKEHHIDVKMLVMVMPERSKNFVGELIETVLLTDLLVMKIGDEIAVEYCRTNKLSLKRQPNIF